MFWNLWVGLPPSIVPDPYYGVSNMVDRNTVVRELGGSARRGMDEFVIGLKV
jgi:hypothetical protein